MKILLVEDDDDVAAVADLALEERLAGIVATNTTISRDGLRSSKEDVAALGAGTPAATAGVSGANANRAMMLTSSARVNQRTFMIVCSLN